MTADTPLLITKYVYCVFADHLRRKIESPVSASQKEKRSRQENRISRVSLITFKYTSLIILHSFSLLPARAIGLVVGK